MRRERMRKKRGKERRESRGKKRVRKERGGAGGVCALQK